MIIPVLVLALSVWAFAVARQTINREATRQHEIDRLIATNRKGGSDAR
jgi:hypothetical protein